MTGTRPWLLRLIPPRPTFAQDMTADERAVMQRHVEYWRGKLAERIAIAFGPVADPSGGWGLGLVLAENESEIEAFEAADPAIQANIGLRYEHHPMANLVY